MNLTAEERNASRDHTTWTATDATAQVRNLARTDQAAADAARATADTRHAAASLSTIGATDRSPVS
jgi:hypothetical protein